LGWLYILFVTHDGLQANALSASTLTAVHAKHKPLVPKVVYTLPIG
jgi:hypothetical protein